jgi:hypothetical protein
MNVYIYIHTLTGYQINGIANRTTIADGNTWNHEHIALLGRSLVSSVKKSHRIVRHLADYVLVWSTRYGAHTHTHACTHTHTHTRTHTHTHTHT